MNSETRYQRIQAPFFSRGTRALLAVLALGFCLALARLLFGLAATTNLDNQYPWGIWVAIDIASGIALAAGGFACAFFVDIAGRERYRPLLRSALLTAWLGYLMETVVLVIDLGRYWNVWQPVVHWQGNSVLFEVGICVIAYILVLSVELTPGLLEGFTERLARRDRGHRLLRPFARFLDVAPRLVGAALPFLILAGVVLSCMHQSSLGTLMVIAPGKMSPLWYSPLLPILFLLSAIMAGFPMVLIQQLVAGWSFGEKPDRDLLDAFARNVPWLIGLYTLVKLGDLIWRRKQLHLGQRPVDTLLLLLELAAGLLAPLGLFLSRRLRRSPRGLFVASLLVVGGVMLNRVNVFLVSYIPPFTRKRYYPSPAEIGLTLSTICAVILLYRFFVLQSPVLGFTRKTALPAVAEPSAKPVRRWWNRALQAAAFLLVLAFVFYYTRVHRRALSGAQDKPWKAQAVQIREQFPQRPFLARNALYPLKYQLVYRLSDPLLHAPRAVYQAVEFSHGRHDGYVAGNCSLCHHRVSFSPSDRSGETISGLHRAIGVDPQGACSGCHADMRNKTFQKCSACHRLANEPDNPLRVGLRAAYHIACLGCHSRQSPSSAAPQRCDACHAPRRQPTPQ